MLTNIRSLDATTPIVLLFIENDPSVIKHISRRYEGLEVRRYPDERRRKDYAPSQRPYLVWRYLSEHPEPEDYFQLDSDVIFRELPDFSQMPLEGKVCWASDCSEYIDYDYLMSCEKGEHIVDRFAEILNIPVKTIKDTPGGGAQWLMSKPTAKLWWHIWQDSELLHRALRPINSDIQKWTAEMWAQLYNLAKFGWDVKLHPELDFCRPTDDVGVWDKVKILHNAGVTGTDEGELFFKGKYKLSMPFDDDLSFVRKDRASTRYVEAVKKVKFT